MTQESIINIDEYLENTDVETIEKKSSRKTPGKKPTSSNEENVNTSTKTKDDFRLHSAADALTASAKVKLEKYLTQSPNFKVLDKQIAILTDEFNNYKKLNEDSLAASTQTMIKELIQKRNGYVKYYKSNINTENREETDKKIKASLELKNLKLKREELEEQFRNLNPNSLLSKVYRYRVILNLNSKDAKDDYDMYNDEVIDFDEFIDDNESLKDITAKEEYNKLCTNIAQLIDSIPSEVAVMPMSELKLSLKNAISEKTLTNLKEQIAQVKFDISNETSNIKGTNDITKIIFDTFDLEEVETEPKEMLAAANVGYVKAIAYNLCSKMNANHLMDDAISYGLLGLTVAINSWYNIQKLKDSPLSFSGFANSYIVGAIKRGLLEVMSSGGMLSGSTMATNLHYQKKQIEAFVKMNPELKDLPQDIIESMIENLPSVTSPIITESAYTDMVGGQDSENGDIWTNASVSNIGDEKFMEVRLEYETILKSIKKFFNLFDVKYDKETGQRIITDKKMFSKFEYKLFKLVYELEFKREAVDSSSKKGNSYTQEDIAKIMGAYNKSLGLEPTSFSQPAISYRIEVLNEKIKTALDKYPELKPGFEYLWNYCIAHSEEINYVSNNREEITMKTERDLLRNKFKDNSEILARQLSDGKKLGDVFQVSDTNMLDDEIANAFTNY